MQSLALYSDLRKTSFGDKTAFVFQNNRLSKLYNAFSFRQALFSLTPSNTKRAASTALFCLRFGVQVYNEHLSAKG